jgi:hypothetical protein
LTGCRRDYRAFCDLVQAWNAILAGSHDRGTQRLCKRLLRWRSAIRVA